MPEDPPAKESAPRRTIALIGFMAAGKTRGATAIARALGEGAPADVDALVEAELGEPIPQYFERAGEAAFREAEERVALAAIERGGIVSLGGGALGSERIRAALGDCVTVWCRVSEEVAWSRARGSGRPLAADRNAFHDLYEERAPLYAEAADVVLPRGGDETPAVAAPWIDALRDRPGLRIAWARAGEAEYPVVVGPDAAALLGAAAAPAIGRRLFPIADPAALAGGVGPPAGAEPAIEFAGGEQQKTLEGAGRVLAEMAAAGIRRDDAIAAIGGGVVGDLAGFCAAVYQRGIPVVQIPTTLVAQVDSALGGKTGVDLPAAKNYVGAYHQPAAVLSDPRALTSLPEAELAAGYAEVVKTALIAGGQLWETVRNGGAPTVALMSQVVFDCALTKIGVVAEDERDGGRRNVLNLGHTIGHAIEVATGYRRYRHGEAVALGLLVALRLSGHAALRDEVVGLFAAAGLPVHIDPEIDLDAVVAATGVDKKQTAEGLGFVLVRAPGDVVHGESVADGDLWAAVEELRR